MNELAASLVGNPLEGIVQAAAPMLLAGARLHRELGVLGLGCHTWRFMGSYVAILITHIRELRIPFITPHEPPSLCFGA